MSLCIDCKDKKFCSSPCAALNKYLKDNGIYSADWIRPKMPSHKRTNKNKYREMPFSNVKNPEFGTISERGVNVGL